MIESWVMGRLERPVAITSTSVKSLELLAIARLCLQSEGLFQPAKCT
jgi:hypothetical protein